MVSGRKMGEKRKATHEWWQIRIMALGCLTANAGKEDNEALPSKCWRKSIFNLGFCAQINHNYMCRIKTLSEISALKTKKNNVSAMQFSLSTSSTKTKTRGHETWKYGNHPTEAKGIPWFMVKRVNQSDICAAVLDSRLFRYEQEGRGLQEGCKCNLQIIWVFVHLRRSFAVFSELGWRVSEKHKEN